MPTGASVFGAVPRSVMLPPTLPPARASSVALLRPIPAPVDELLAKPAPPTPPPSVILPPLLKISTPAPPAVVSFNNAMLPLPSPS